MSKAKSIPLVLGILLASGAVVGCSNQYSDKVNQIQSALSSSLVNKSANDNNPVKSFAVLGADVDKIAFDYNVKFNGVSALQDGTKAFTKVNYSVPAEYFASAKKSSSASLIYDILDDVVNICDIQNYTITPVNDLKGINDAIVKNTIPPFEDFFCKSTYVYTVSSPTFDDTHKTVSFTTEEMSNIQKERNSGQGFGLGWGVGFDGSFGIGIGFFGGIKTAGDYIFEDKYTLKLTDNQFEQMKNDNKIVYDTFVNAVNNKDTENLSAQRQNARCVSYDATSVMQNLNYNNIEENLNS